MSNTNTDKKRLLEWIDRNRPAFDELALEIWKKPELAYNERLAAKLQMDFLKKRGFTVTQKEEMPTAFMAQWGRGGPVIGLLGEYDALSGLSQKKSAAKEPEVKDAPGHGCGHNLLGVGCLLAACAAKELFEAEKKPCTLRYFGCPGEEQLTGKGRMAKLNYFEGTDLALTWHPNDFSYVTDATMTAVFSAKFKFTGRSAHAGNSPEAGRSALDAVELMNVGANYLREHTVDQDRLHYVITNGGLAPNIVPAEAEVWYFVRAPHDRELASLWQRLVKVAQGAAIMTETEVAIEKLGGCYNTLPNKVLNQVLTDNLMDFAGGPGFDEADLAFAREIQASLPQEQVEGALRKPIPVPEDSRLLARSPLPSYDSGGYVMGSTDVGDVANMMPTSMVWGATWPVGVPHHSWQAVACTGTAMALKGAGLMAKTLAGTIYDLASDQTLIKSAQQEFTERRQGRKYRPIEELLEQS